MNRSQVGLGLVAVAVFLVVFVSWNIDSCNERALARVTHIRQIKPYHCLANISFQTDGADYSSIIDIPCPVVEGGVLPVCYSHGNPSNAALDRMFLYASPGSNYLPWKLVTGALWTGLVLLTVGTCLYFL